MILRVKALQVNITINKETCILLDSSEPIKISYEVFSHAVDSELKVA